VDVPFRIERDDLVRPRRDDEAAERRPGGLAIASEQPLRAVRLDDPRPARGVDEQPAGRGQREQLALRFFTPTASRIAWITDRPGGLASTPATAATATTTIAGRQ